MASYLDKHFDAIVAMHGEGRNSSQIARELIARGVRLPNRPSAKPEYDVGHMAQAITRVLRKAGMLTQPTEYRVALSLRLRKRERLLAELSALDNEIGKLRVRR